MRALPFLRICAVSFFVAACGGRVVFESASGAGGSSTTASSAQTTTGSTSSKTATSTTGGQGCMGSIDVAADNGIAAHWAAVCYGSWGQMWSKTAVGYEFSAGPAPIGVTVEGCENSGDAVQSPGIRLTASNAMSPGTYTIGSVQYTGSAGTTWSSSNGGPYQMTITNLQTVGGYIDGTFSAVVVDTGGASHTLSGSFHVCRVQDQLGMG